MASTPREGKGKTVDNGNVKAHPDDRVLEKNGVIEDRVGRTRQEVMGILYGSGTRKSKIVREVMTSLLEEEIDEKRNNKVR